MGTEGRVRRYSDNGKWLSSSTRSPPPLSHTRTTPLAAFLSPSLSLASSVIRIRRELAQRSRGGHERSRQELGARYDRGRPVDLAGRAVSAGAVVFGAGPHGGGQGQVAGPAVAPVRQSAGTVILPWPLLLWAMVVFSLLLLC